MIRFFAGLVFLLSSLAQAGPLSEYFLPSPDTATLNQVAQLFELTNREGNNFHVLVPQEQANLFLLLAPRAHLLEADTSAAIQARLNSYKSRRIFSAARYHNFDEVQAWAQAQEKAFPQIAKVVPYGLSKGGRPLIALQIGSDVNAPTTKPSLMITAATHGDELITTEVLMELVNQMLANYGQDQRFTDMVNNHNIYFIPVLNADGFASTNRYDGNRDPNRSYPYPGNDKAAPTPSIAAIMKFFNGHNIVGSIDFHAYGELTMYPWAYTHDPIEPRAGEKFKRLTASMSEKNRYTYGPISDVIYIAVGSSCDYYFWQKNTTSVAIEMGSDKIPDPSEFQNYVTAQAESTWRFIESF